MKKINAMVLIKYCFVSHFALLDCRMTNSSVTCYQEPTKDWTIFHVISTRWKTIYIYIYTVYSSTKKKIIYSLKEFWIGRKETTFRPWFASEGNESFLLTLVVFWPHSSFWPCGKSLLPLLHKSLFEFTEKE